MADPAAAAGRAVDELTDEPLPGLPMTSVDRIEADLLAEERRIHRYTVDEVWGDAPEWLAAMCGDPEAFMLTTYRGEVTQWEVEKAGRIVYGFCGEYAGVSPVALEQGIVLACTIAASGGFIVGVAFGLLMARERARSEAARPAPHEALRPLYEPAALRLGPGRP